VASGLHHRYGIRLSTDPNGAGGWLLVADSPATQNNATHYDQSNTSGYFDANGDVGGAGLNVTAQDDPNEKNGDGYEDKRIVKGKLDGGKPVIFDRLDPNNLSI